MMMKIPTVVARKLGYALVKDPGGSAGHFGALAASTNLSAVHMRDGKQVKKYDFGSGTISEALVLALAKDWVGTTNNKAAPILSSLKYMYSGTGAATEQAYDYALQTPVNVSSGVITPVISVETLSNHVTIQWTGTIAYTGTSAITEWGLFNAESSTSEYNTSSVTYAGTLGSSASTITPGSSPSWSTNAYAGHVAICGSSSGTPNQSGASYYGAFIESNSATALTVAQATNDGIGYWTINNNGGPGATPTNNTRFDIWPLMADRKTFQAINVNSGDSIQFLYSLTLQSGG